MLTRPDEDPPQDEKRKVYKDGPFAAKWMAGSDKQIIADAADRANMNAGEWIGYAARLAVAAEREKDFGHTEVLPPETGAVIVHSASPLTMAELDIAMRMAERLAELRGHKLDGRARNAAKRTLVQVERLLVEKVTAA